MPSRLVRIPLCFVLLLSACADDEEGPQTCDVANPQCPEGQVCVGRDGESPACQAPCDPAAADACDAGLSCNLLTSGDYACVPPVVLRGRVFDATTDAPVEGALVAAAGEAGAVETTVAVTGADGRYELAVPARVNPSLDGIEGIFTLRVSAADYLPFPSALRPAIPVDAADGERDPDSGPWAVENATTDVAMIPLPPSEQGQGSISGTVAPEGSGGALVVAECGTPPCPYAFADADGTFTIFNVPAGSYTVAAYKGGIVVTPASVDVADAEDVTGVVLDASGDAPGSVTGSVNIVNPEDGDATSVVLVPESTFLQLTEVFVLGQIPPGLRDPAPPEAPTVGGAYMIDGVPPGDYAVLAAFENDFLIRDPDPNISGTQIVHITVGAGETVDVPTGFKITGGLTIVGPGADGPEEVDAAGLTFRWKDDSSETRYVLIVFDAFGNEVWRDDNVPAGNGGVVEHAYGGPDLEPGMYYQWRAISHKDTGGNPGPISTTEDLLGVFHVAQPAGAGQ